MIRDFKIVFDTNAYRTFITPTSEEETKKRITRLIQLEKSRNIKVLMATDVAVELYSHLDDLNDKEYYICKNAVIAQYMHCLENDSPRYILNSDIHLCNLVFGKMPELSYNEQNKILYMSQFLYKNSSPLNLQGYIKNFKIIQQYHQRLKNDFINKLKEFSDGVQSLREKLKTSSSEETIKLNKELTSLRKELDGEISKNKLAEGLLIRAASSLDIELKNLSKEDIDEKIDFIKSNFLVPIIFFRNILKSIIDSSGSYDFDDSKKANNFTDYQLTFQLNKFVGDERLIFVSDDKRFRTAVKEAGFSDCIIILEGYLKELNY